MARSALTTAWSEIGTAVTGGFFQNLGDDPILVAFAAAEPEALAAVGFVLQAHDYLPMSGLTATNVYARTFSGTGALEALTTA